MPKLLRELLQEQQEPFALDIFLVERGFRNRARSFEKLEDLPKCVTFAKALFSRLVSQNDYRGKKIKCKERNNRGRECPNLKENREGNKGGYGVGVGAELYLESGALFLDEKVYEEGERILRPKGDESNKQLSPISVLEETEEGPPPLQFHANNYKFIQKRRQESKKLAGPHSFDQYIINERALRQTKRLVMDCVREVIEKQRERDREKSEEYKRIVGSDELWQLMCENVWLWSQDSKYESENNTLALLNCDVLESEEHEWVSISHIDQDEIGVEIGEAILEFIISEIFFI